MPPSSYNKKEISIPPPIDPKEIRQQIRLLIRHLSSVHDRDTSRQTHIIINEIWQLIEYASLQLHRGEYAQALICSKKMLLPCVVTGEQQCRKQDSSTQL